MQCDDPVSYGLVVAATASELQSKGYFGTTFDVHFDHIDYMCLAIDFTFTEDHICPDNFKPILRGCVHAYNIYQAR